MNILVLGGTQFLGRHFVDLALKCGHKVTLFNRAKSNPHLFNNVTQVTGDRNIDLNFLKGLTFDVVLDTCGYFANNVKDTALLMKDICNQYIFISTCSVYDMDQLNSHNNDENSPIVNLDVEPNVDNPLTYGARKYLCEQEVQSIFSDQACIIRPGLIVGPHDQSYRFSYWADRVSEGGTILAPGDPNAPVQFIDVRDLSSFILQCLENSINGVFNVVSPQNSLTMSAFLNEVKNLINPESKFQWVSEEFLQKNEIACWSQLPLWIYKDLQNFCRLDSQKAVSHGLSFSHLSDTILDTHAWSKNIYQQRFLQQVLNRDLEKSLIEQYL